MNAQLFSDAMNGISLKYVDEALTYRRPAKKHLPMWTKRCAAACLTLTLGLGAVLAASPAVRAELVRWVESRSGTQITYRYAGEKRTGRMPYYDLTALPDGFAPDAAQSFESEDYRRLCYVRGDERLILDYIYMQDDNWSIYDKSGDAVSKVMVGENEGTLYLSGDPARWSTLEWIDPSLGLHFTLNACGSEKELLALAESVALSEPRIALAPETEGRELTLDELDAEKLDGTVEK